MMKASLLYPSQCILGEGPLWHQERQSCLWVDIENYRLYELDWGTRNTKSWTFESKPTAVLPTNGDHLILTLQGGVARFHPETESLNWITPIELEKPEHRTNDAKSDTSGRLWVGTMHKHQKQGAGALYSISTNLEVQKKVDQVTISNGLVWTLDDQRLYYIDSPTQCVQSFHYDKHSGTINFEKIIIQIPENLGTPDGMTIDSEGMLWIAHWGGFGVYKWNPLTGQLLDKIELPVPNVSSCAFAGESLDHLVITTASEHLSEDELKRYPESGHLFVAKTTSKGIAANRCAL